MLICHCPNKLVAQSVEEIKSKTSEFIYGEGHGTTLSRADDNALADLLRKISVTVKSDFLSIEKEEVGNESFSSETTYESIIQTYSTATLNNTDRIIIKPEPDASVLRYIKKVEIDRIFKSRENKVEEFIEIAQNALEKNQIDDALRYYYWAYCLVKSLRYPNEKKMNVDGVERFLVSWLPSKIEEILQDISLSAKQIGNDHYELTATYKGKPIRSLDYSYFDGKDNSAICSIKDGLGEIEMRSGLHAKSANVKIEYEFQGLAVIDPEIASVLKSQEASIFKKAYLAVSLPQSNFSDVQTSLNLSTKSLETPTSTLAISVDEKVLMKIQRIHDAIQKGQVSTLKELFTNEGWIDFQKIISYGKISVGSNQNWDFFTDGEETICRGMSCVFRFQNNRTFNEQLTFTFDSFGKISHVALGLGKQMAEDEILCHNEWGVDARKKIVSFLEDYRTAYASKNIEYMERVFDDNAIIIVGRKLQVASKTPEGKYLQNKYVKLTQYTKDQFLKHLKANFANKSYINLHFSNCSIVQLQKGVERYGIQIKQDYYSNNYGDTGYLYLLVDLTNPKEPIIHVRTWQENPDPEFGVIGPGHF